MIVPDAARIAEVAFVGALSVKKKSRRLVQQVAVHLHRDRLRDLPGGEVEDAACDT